MTMATTTTTLAAVRRLLVLATTAAVAAAFQSSAFDGGSPVRGPSCRRSLSPGPLASSAMPGGGGGGETKMKKKQLKTLQRFLEVECWKRTDLRPLESVFLGVGDACKQIHRIVRRAQTDDLYGPAADPLTGLVADENVQGEQPQQLDVLCNTIMLRAFCGAAGTNVLRGVASEEEDSARSCRDVMMQPDAAAGLSGVFGGGAFAAAFDPIDGSKNIDASLPVGTVFGIYRCPRDGKKDDGDTCGVDVDGCFMQKGTNLVAAGYCLYSATTVLVLTLGSGVHGFTLDPDKQVFLQTHPDMRVPDRGSLYSFNEANYREFSDPVQRYLSSLKENANPKSPPYARYVGALVADVHNVLINGGIYGYPPTRSHRAGKLRLLYESAPMAMIMEQAGGAGSTGTGRLLDVDPDEIHMRVPTFLGSVENVFELDQFHQYYGGDEE